MRYDWIAHALICGLTTYAFGWPVGLGIGIAKEVWDLALVQAGHGLIYWLMWWGLGWPCH